LNDRLVAVGANAVGEETIELYRVACGIPLYGQDIRERDLPQETNQARALHFSKGCYVGQEIVERIRSRGSVHRQFSKFRVEGPLPALGTKIQSSGKDVGEITSSAVLPEPEGDRATALGYIRKEASLPGQDLKAGEARLELE
jgi:folate-binding protein YgfZ